MSPLRAYHRRHFLLALPLPCLLGCLPLGGPTTGQLEAVWGRRGLTPGRLQKPRAMAIDEHDEVYIVDMTGRIQVFSLEGDYLRGWRTPAIESGKPCGLSFDAEGNLLVADTHYFRMLVYTPEGERLDHRTIGGVCGREPGEFSFVTDCVQDSQGNFFISEYGDFDRVQKFSPEGEFLLQWGSHGEAPGQFIQPRSLAVDRDDHVWVTDACNHRIQVFDARGSEARLVRCWGQQGREPGQFRYPYGIDLNDRGEVYVCEFGNSRVQKLDQEGRLLASWGHPGRRDGELNQPWEVALDQQGHLLILDTYNHRVQRIFL